VRHHRDGAHRAFQPLAGKRFCASGHSWRVAAAVAITVKTCWTIAKPHYEGDARLRVVFIGAAAFLLHLGAGLSAIQVLLLAAVIGAFLPAASNT
jgi:hypothetical protein